MYKTAICIVVETYAEMQKIAQTTVTEIFKNRTALGANGRGGGQPQKFLAPMGVGRLWY